jgi:hypothetical protein
VLAADAQFHTLDGSVEHAPWKSTYRNDPRWLFMQASSPRTIWAVRGPSKVTDVGKKAKTGGRFGAVGAGQPVFPCLRLGRTDSRGRPELQGQ